MIMLGRLFMALGEGPLFELACAVALFVIVWLCLW